MSDSVLITPRRNFLIRALGFTAAGAAVSVPIITVADAKARVEHHRAELEKAMRDYYAGLDILVKGGKGGVPTRDDILRSSSDQEPGRDYACLIFMASKPEA